MTFYDERLPVERFKVYLSAPEIGKFLEFYDIKPNRIEEHLEEWCGQPGGGDRDGWFYWSDRNPRAKHDWSIIGGKWTGHLKLKPGATGELGNPGKTLLEEDPNDLRYGLLSTDVAKFGDIDWVGMREHERGIAAGLWEKYNHAKDRSFVGFLLGIEPHWSEEEYLTIRSHPATSVVVKDSDWYERGEIGWQGVLLDALPVEIWHERYDELISDVTPDTTISIIDAHT